jgi:hypothetical protein
VAQEAERVRWNAAHPVEAKRIAHDRAQAAQPRPAAPVAATGYTGRHPDLETHKWLQDHPVEARRMGYKTVDMTGYTPPSPVATAASSSPVSSPELEAMTPEQRVAARDAYYRSLAESEQHQRDTRDSSREMAEHRRALLADPARLREARVSPRELQMMQDSLRDYDAGTTAASLDKAYEVGAKLFPRYGVPPLPRAPAPSATVAAPTPAPTPAVTPKPAAPIVAKPPGAPKIGSAFVRATTAQGLAWWTA